MISGDLIEYEHSTGMRDAGLGTRDMEAEIRCTGTRGGHGFVVIQDLGILHSYSYCRQMNVMIKTYDTIPKVDLGCYAVLEVEQLRT